MSTTADTSKAAAALSGPPQRPRADKSNLPKPPGAAASKDAEAEAKRKAEEEQEAAEAEAKRKTEEEAAAKAKAEQEAAEAEAKRKAEEEAAAAAARRQATASKARRQLAARNAEQTFLPLVSRVAKLREWVEQAELAVADAIELGVEPGLLEDTLKSIARKNEVPFEDIPESVRKAVSGA